MQTDRSLACDLPTNDVIAEFGTSTANSHRTSSAWGGSWP